MNSRAQEMEDRMVTVVEYLPKVCPAECPCIRQCDGTGSPMDGTGKTTIDPQATA